MNTTDLPLKHKLTTAKWAFTTRRVNRSDVASITPDLSAAISGDLVLAQVLNINQHKRVQLAEGRPSIMYPDDLIVATCADRYAPDQFKALAQLDPEGSDLVAGGGIIGKMYAAHEEMSRPTEVKPLGLLSDAAGKVINIQRYALPMAYEIPNSLTVIGVVGSSMNAGKTTSAASLAHGLSKAGYRVAGIKLTGTGSFGDFNAFRDAGLSIVADFTDAGMASTYHQPIERIQDGFASLLKYAASEGAKVAVVEIADGIFQQETSQLLRDSTLREHLSGLLFTAPDALSAVGGIKFLQKIDLTPLAISGPVSASPLASAETAAQCEVNVVTKEQLRDPHYASAIWGGLYPSTLKLSTAA